MEAHACCAPSAEPRTARPAAPTRHPARGRPRGQVPIPAGQLRDGRRASTRATPPTARRPCTRSRLGAFRIDATAVTNAQFATFVKDTGHVTEAEEFGVSAVFHLAVRRATAGTSCQPGRRHALVAGGPRRDWRHPERARLRRRTTGRTTPSCTSPGTTPRPTPLGRQAAAHRGRVGVRRPRRPRPRALRLGRRAHPARPLDVQHLAGRASPRQQHRTTTATSPPRPRQRSRPTATGSTARPATSGSGARTGSHPATTRSAPVRPARAGRAASSG